MIRNKIRATETARGALPEYIAIRDSPAHIKINLNTSERNIFVSTNFNADKPGGMSKREKISCVRGERLFRSLPNSLFIHHNDSDKERKPGKRRSGK